MPGGKQSNVLTLKEKD